MREAVLCGKGTVGQELLFKNKYEVWICYDKKYLTVLVTRLANTSKTPKYVLNTISNPREAKSQLFVMQKYLKGIFISEPFQFAFSAQKQ